MIAVLRSVFHKGNKFYLKVSLDEYLYKLKMLKYDMIDLFEGTGVNEINEPFKCIICSYYYFFEVNFRFQPKACNGCHDLMQKPSVLMALQLFLLKEMKIEFIFDI